MGYTVPRPRRRRGRRPSSARCSTARHVTMPTPTRRPGLTPSEPAGASSLSPVAISGRTLGALILLILVELVIAQSLNMFPHVIAIDFYQYWAVGAAPRVSDRTLGTPYADRRQYGEAIKDYAERTHQTRLTVNGTVLSPTGFTATPFLYVLFALLPPDYEHALVLFHVLQIAVFVGA